MFFIELSTRYFEPSSEYKPSHKLRLYLTKHKDKTAIIETKNAIYMIPCGDCSQRYIGQTSKKIATRITEHKNAIKRHDLKSLPATHTYDNCHFQLGKNTITRTSTNEIRTRI